MMIRQKTPEGILAITEGLAIYSQAINVLTKDKLGKAVIDFVLVCDEMREFVKSLFIDEKRIHVLTKYANKKGIKIQKSVTDFPSSWKLSMEL